MTSDLLSPSEASAVDRHILASQILALVREEVLDLLVRRLAGMSWSDIGTLRSEDPHALEARFGYELARIRKLLRIT